jgi:hypothetical protein
MNDSTMTLEKFNEIISDLKNQSNGELERVMDFLNDDFQETKEMIINLTYHLDNIEEMYHKILKEHESRINGQRS